MRCCLVVVCLCVPRSCSEKTELKDGMADGTTVGGGRPDEGGSGSRDGSSRAGSDTS